MDKIEKIKQAIEDADKLKSKLTISTAYDVPALASLRIRCLLNNLGEITTNYMECGVHRGGTFCSSVNNNPNIQNAFAIDNWASDHMGGQIHESQFMEAATKFTHQKTNLQVIKSDCFSVDLSKVSVPIDTYLYDASHDYLDQLKALTYYYPVLADEFIYLCDDYDLLEVQEGTKDGIKETRLKVLFERYLVGNDHDNDGWWRGYYVALLKK